MTEIAPIFDYYSEHLRVFIPEIEKVFTTIEAMHDRPMAEYAVAVEQLCSEFLVKIEQCVH